MNVRPAVPADVGAIVDLRAELRRWLAARGSDQWSEAVPGWTDRVAADITAGNTWVVERDGRVVATMTVNGTTDPGLWSAAEQVEAQFVHRVMVARQYAGWGLGRLLLVLAREVAVARGARFLRLDAWTSNTALHRYYLALGWRHVRTVEGAGTPSAALFELPIT